MKNKHFAKFLVVVGLLIGSFTNRVVAQTADFAFASSADYAFGQVMRFHLTAENPDPIVAASLFFQTASFPNTFVIDVPVETGTHISLSKEVDLTQTRLPPFADVTYWWVLRTAESQDLTIPAQTIWYEDDRFEWRMVTQEQLTVHWTGTEAGLGQLALDIVAESLPRLAAVMPVTNETPLNIYIYPSSQDLRAALRLTGRDWVGAHADPQLGVILVTAVNARTAPTDLRRALPHELVHFLLYQAAGVGYETLPMWFNEGLATFVETNPNPNYETALETAVSDGTTLPFTDLCHSFPAEENKAVLAYAQSLSLVQYIQAHYGNQALRDMVAAYADGANCESGVSRVLQQPLDELAQTWLQTLQPRSPVAQLMQNNALLVLLFVGGFMFTALLIFHPANKDYQTRYDQTSL